MPLQDSISTFGRSLQHLHDALEALRLVLADRPPAAAHALLDQLEAEVDQLRFLFEEAFAAYSELRRADAPRDRQHLRRAQESVLQIGRSLACDLESAERLGEVMDIGLTRSPVWRAWSVSVRGCLAATRRPVWEAVEASFTCWQELAERTVVMAAPAR